MLWRYWERQARQNVYSIAVFDFCAAMERFIQTYNCSCWTHIWADERCRDREGGQIQQLFRRQLCSQRKWSQAVHYEIDPEHLHCCQGAFLTGHSSRTGCHYCHHIYHKLQPIHQAVNNFAGGSGSCPRLIQAWFEWLQEECTKVEGAGRV